jgi:uncharacterized protein YbcC (UPF0753/DUF2309 family)
MMLNDKRVRTLLAGRGVLIPDTTHFVGGLHNTATDEITLSTSPGFRSVMPLT